MDFKFSKQEDYRDFGTMQLGISPYCIFDMKDKVLYLPDLNMIDSMSNKDYQNFIEDEVLMNSMDRYNTLLMSGIEFEKVKKMNLGTYKLNPFKTTRGSVHLDDYVGYFITDKK